MKASEIFEGENSSLRKTFDSIASSPQPEEWERNLREEFVKISGVAGNPIDWMSLDHDRVQKLISSTRAEIRKAEERMLQRLHVGDIKEAEFEALQHGLGADHFMEGFRYARNNLQKQKNVLLEALKK